MFEADVEKLAAGAAGKAALLRKRPWAYCVSSMLAGVYVGVGVLLANSLTASLGGSPLAKTISAASFAIALSLVVFAGADLFTGNVMHMTIGWRQKAVSGRDACRVCAVCFAGNWAGALVLALLFWGTGLMDGPLGEVMATAAAAKMSIPPLALVLRGMLCNMLVCLGVWCAARCKSEAARLIMIFWCLFAFVACGFEHCVANMTLLTLSLLHPAGQTLYSGGYFYNILVSAFGNILGGALLVALPYLFISHKKEEETS